MNGADLLVAALENEGVTQIFGVPGEENLDVVEALRRSRIELVLTRHEQAAAFMAATHGRLTGRPGVCLATLGPGALNFTTGAAYALLGAMPMVMITGQKGILSSRQARFQIVDVVAAMRPLTKLSHQIVSTRMIPTLVREAFRVAQLDVDLRSVPSRSVAAISTPAVRLEEAVGWFGTALDELDAAFPPAERTGAPGWSRTPSASTVPSARPIWSVRGTPPTAGDGAPRSAGRCSV